MITLTAPAGQVPEEQLAQEALEKIAEKLRKTNKPTTERLIKLSEALGDEDLGKQWIATDIHKMIDPEAVVEKYKAQIVPGRLTGVLEWVRNFAILLPLVLTWLGISRAVDAYGKLLAANNSLITTPFLDLWQQKFYGYLHPWWFFDFTLGSLALTDFLLLLGILALTMIVTFKSHLIHVTREREAEELREELSDALAGAALLLSKKKLAQPDSFRDVINELAKIAGQFDTTTKEFMKELEQERNNRGAFTNFITALQEISSNLRDSATSIEKTSQELNKGINELLEPIKIIPDQQKTLVIAADKAVLAMTGISDTLRSLLTEHDTWRKEVQDVLATSLKELIEKQEQSGRDLHGMLNTSLQRLYDEQVRQGGELQTTVKDLFGRAIVEQIKAGQQLHDLLSNSLGQLAAEQTKWGQQFLQAVDSLDTTVEQIDKAILAIEAAVRNEGKLVKAMEAERYEQTELVNKMTATSRDMESALIAIKNWGPDLYSIAVNMGNAVNELKLMPDVIKTELFDALKSYSSAAAKVADSANTLMSAATAIESAATKLDGRLGP